MGTRGVVVFMLGLTSAVAAVSAQTFCESSGRVVMEAEHYDTRVRNNDPNGLDWFESSAPGTPTGGQCLTTTDMGTFTNCAGCEATFAFSLSSAGLFSLAAKVWGPHGSSNTTCYLMDGNIVASTGSATYNQWTLLSVTGNLSLTSGNHVLTIRRYEDGCAVDRIYLVRQGSGTPTDAWAETPCGGGPWISGPTNAKILSVYVNTNGNTSITFDTQPGTQYWINPANTGANRMMASALHIWQTKRTVTGVVYQNWTGVGRQIQSLTVQ